MQRCRVGYLPNLRSGDNLLADNKVLNIYDYGTELNERNYGVPRHNQNLS